VIAGVADTHAALWYLLKNPALSIVEAMLKVPRAEVPDMPDRIVAATGLHLGVPVISRDGRIRSSSVKTVW
jgi:PIN domain nuclease of toxin-antitoxin system